MSEIVGKCHCGKNKFTIKPEPEFQFICYCESCRIINSGGHLCGILLDKCNFTEAQQTQIYTYDGGSGNSIVLHFCPTCATHLYAYPTSFKDKVVIRANTLKDYAFKPQQHLFVESAFTWDKPTAL
ncbi:MAG: GFA family protein [Gammaproteobacteria bacterium]